MPKGYPLKTISGRFGSTGGNGKIMVSRRLDYHFHVWKGPQRPLAPHSACNIFQCCSRKDFFTICLRFGPWGGLTKVPRTTSSATCSTLSLWVLGSPGSPKDLQVHQNDANTTPKQQKNHAKTLTPNNKQQKQNVEKLQAHIHQPITLSGHGGGSPGCQNGSSTHPRQQV